MNTGRGRVHLAVLEHPPTGSSPCRNRFGLPVPTPGAPPPGTDPGLAPGDGRGSDWWNRQDRRSASPPARRCRRAAAAPRRWSGPGRARLAPPRSHRTATRPRTRVGTAFGVEGTGPRAGGWRRASGGRPTCRGHGSGLALRTPQPMRPDPFRPRRCRHPDAPVGWGAGAIAPPTLGVPQSRPRTVRPSSRSPCCLTLRSHA